MRSILAILLIILGLPAFAQQRGNPPIPVWSSQLNQARTPYLDSDNYVMCIKPGGCGPNDPLTYSTRADLLDLFNYIDQRLANLPGATIISCIGIAGGTLVQGSCPGGGGGGGGGNVVANNTLTAHAPVIGDSGTETIKTTAALQNGQMLIGSTGVDPVPALITGGAGITVSAGAGSLTVSATGSGGTVTQNGNLTTNAPVIGGNNGSSDVKTVSPMTNDQLLFGVTGGAPVPRTVTKDCSFLNGQITCTKTNNVSFAAIATSGSGTDITTGTVASSHLPTDVAYLDVPDQVVTGGANFTSQSQSTGNIVVDCGKRPGQTINNTGAFTISAPANDGYCFLDVKNGVGAGAVTPFGFSPNSIGGNALDTTNGHNFRLYISRNGGIATIDAKALQ